MQRVKKLLVRHNSQTAVLSQHPFTLSPPTIHQHTRTLPAGLSVAFRDHVSILSSLVKMKTPASLQAVTILAGMCAVSIPASVSAATAAVRAGVMRVTGGKAQTKNIW